MSWPRRAPGERALILGHRGASAHVTENTLDAFARARTDGADGVELDARLCKSGEVVVFHDDTLERLAGRDSAVADMTWSQLRQVELAGGTRVPLLREVLGEIDGLINVEIKSPRPVHVTTWSRSIAEVIVASGAASRVLVTSFHPGVIAYLRVRGPRLDLGALANARQPRAVRSAYFAMPGLAAVHPEHVLIDEDSARRWRRRGLAVGAWTVDEPARARELDALGVTALITNDPARLRRGLGS